MRENCRDELVALERINTVPQGLIDLDPEVANVETAKIAALAVDWMGFKALVKNPVYRNTLKRLPHPKDNETDVDYIQRMWPLMKPDEQGVALDMGIERMVTMRKLADTGVHLRVWQAYESGEWQYSPTGENTFRKWVRSILVDVLEGSASEATKLANVCEAIGWLKFNKVAGVKLPKDLDSCFKSPDYRRWDSVSAKILARAKMLEHDLESEIETSVVQEVADLVEAVSSDKPYGEVQKVGRMQSRIQPIVILEEDRDDAGLRLCRLELTDTQYRFLLKKLDADLDYRLEGETLEDKSYVLIEYRIQTTDICTECHARNTRFVDICTECKESDCIQTEETRSMRQWSGDKWTNWVTLKNDDGTVYKIPDGIFDSALSDPDLKLEYFRQWEVITNG